jgi:hypothetical protein
MTGRCEDCIHNRPQRQLADLLTNRWSLGTADSIRQSQETQTALERAEAGLKRALMQRNAEAWPKRPRVLGYCGLKESEDLFYIGEMKNRGGICEDFVASNPGQIRNCETCRHFVQPRGPQRDHANLMDFIDPSLNSYNDGMSEAPGSTSRSGTINSNIDQLMRVSETRRSVEMSMAMSRGEGLPTEPEYYPWCAHYSKAGRNYVLCTVQNPASQCPGWEFGARRS